MKIKVLQLRIPISTALIALLSMGTLVGLAQDLVPVSSITGSSSVFVFRSAQRQVKRRAPASKPTRTKAQRLESVAKINRQYDTIARTTPRPNRTKIIDPNQLPPNPRTLPAAEGSRLFAGVGEYYIEQRDFDLAIQFFGDSIKLDENNISAKTGMSEALAGKGAALLVKDQSGAAKSNFLEALEYDPNNSAASFGLGEIYAELEQNEEAIASYERALQSEKALTEIFVPLGILYFQAGQVAKADELLTKALASAAGSAQTQFFLGLVRSSQNRNEEALLGFQKAKELDPEYAEAFYNSGEVLVRLKRPVEAIPDYERAVAINPDYFDAWLGLGEAQYQTEKFADALVSFQTASKLKNDNWETYSGWGETLLRAGQFTDAAARLNLAAVFLTRNENFDKTTAADLYSKVGYAYGQQCEIDIANFRPCQWSAAIKALEKAIELSGDSIDYSNLGWAYFNASRIDLRDKRLAEQQDKLLKAKAALEKVTSTDPVIADSARQNLGAVLNDLGDFAGAIVALRRVYDNHPEWTFSGYALGTAYFKVNDFDNSAKTLRQVVDRGPSPHYLAALKNLGAAEIKRKNGREVKRIVEELKKVSPADALALERDMKVARL